MWDLSNVIVDDLSSRVLVLNVAAEGTGLAEWLTDAARYGTPFQVTLHQLVSHPIRLAIPGYSAVRTLPSSGAPARNSAPLARRSYAPKAGHQLPFTGWPG